jgi:hypothetical protein
MTVTGQPTQNTNLNSVLVELPTIKITDPEDQKLMLFEIVTGENDDLCEQVTRLLKQLQIVEIVEYSATYYCPDCKQPNGMLATLPYEISKLILLYNTMPWEKSLFSGQNCLHCMQCQFINESWHRANICLPFIPFNEFDIPTDIVGSLIENNVLKIWNPSQWLPDEWESQSVYKVLNLTGRPSPNTLLVELCQFHITDDDDQKQILFEVPNDENCPEKCIIDLLEHLGIISFCYIEHETDGMFMRELDDDIYSIWDQEDAADEKELKDTSDNDW